MSANENRECRIKNWDQFARKVRPKGCSLLKRLDEFPSSVLVTGCQRSGTTMLSRIITNSEGMFNYWFGQDDELDAALILAGYVNHLHRGRYCFQTTYLNDRYHEYYEHNRGHKIIWVLRNPFSVVHSMLYNWNRGVLDRLFQHCGASFLAGADKRRYERFGLWGVRRVLKACLAYKGKTLQVFELKERLGDKRIMVIDYDDLVTEKERILPAIYQFIELPYKGNYADQIHAKSLNKALRLSEQDRILIEKLCTPIYEKSKTLLTLI